MMRTRIARMTSTMAVALLLATASGAASSSWGAGAPPSPFTAIAPARAGTRIVVVITGETGKTEFESALGRELADSGNGVLILDAKAYLSTAKTPSRAASEVEESLRRYAKVWNRPRIVLVGYSRGADIAPFIANRLSADLKPMVDGVVLLAPAGRASFELTLREAVTKRPRTTDLPVMPELERLRGTKLLCAYGRQETAAFCSRVDSTLMRVVVRGGGHKLAQADGRSIAKLIFERVGP
jgi:type IV secretory pathway VirJ component